MATANRTEYLEYDGYPVANHAIEHTNLEALWSPPELRIQDRQVPYHAGDAISSRPITGPRTDLLNLVLVGATDSDGNANADSRAGLQATRDELLRDVFRPRQNTNDGLVTSRLYLPDGTTRIADAKIVGSSPPTPSGAGALRISLDHLIPAGYWRSETVTTVTSPTVTDGTTHDLTVPNAGTADQYGLAINITGGATSTVRLSSLTWDATGDTWLDFNGDVSPAGGVDIDTDAWTAERDGVSVVGLIDHSGHERWLPLVPGDNTIRIAPTGGDVTVTVDHYARYL